MSRNHQPCRPTLPEGVSVDGHELPEIDHLSTKEKFDFIQRWTKERHPESIFDDLMEAREYALFTYAYLASEPEADKDCASFWREYQETKELPYYVDRTALVLYLYYGGEA